MKYFFATALFFLFVNLSWSTEFVLTDNDPDGIFISRYIEYYEDKSKTLTIDDFMVMGDLPTMGAYPETESNYWFRVTIVNLSNITSFVMVIRSPPIDYIDFYYHNLNNDLIEYHTGDRLPFNYRPIDYDQHFSFPVELKKGKNILFFKCQSTSYIRVPSYLYSDRNYLEHQNDNSFITGIMIGFIFLLCVLFGILAIYSKKIPLIFLFISLCCELYLVLQEYGLAFKYLWYNHPLIDDYSLLPVLLIYSTSTLMIVNCFYVDDEHRLKKIWKLFIKGTISLNIICGILLFFLDFSQAKAIIYNTFCLTYFVGCIFLIILFKLKKPYTVALVGYYLALFVLSSEKFIQMITIYSNSNFLLINYIPITISIIATLCWGVGVVNATSIYMQHQDSFINNLKIAIKKSEEIEEKFVTALCHELGTPVQTASYAIEKLHRYIENDMAKKQLYRLDISVKKLLFLASNFIQKAQSKHYQSRLNFEKTDIVELINIVLTSLAPFKFEYQHNIIFMNKNDKNEYVIEIDKNLIEQAFSNVILNSIKYTPVGGKIIIEVKKDSDNLLISVVDNGYGIRLENSNDIFMAFYRSDILKNISGGVGIGLSITKKIIDDHGGIINYVSPLPHEYKHLINTAENRYGTIFNIYLPEQKKG